MLCAGHRQRHVGSHALNDRSSRSHLVVTVTVTARDSETGQEDSRGKLNLVDLAGSERLKRIQQQQSSTAADDGSASSSSRPAASGHQQQVEVEARHINRSLSGSCYPWPPSAPIPHLPLTYLPACLTDRVCCLPHACLPQPWAT